MHQSGLEPIWILSRTDAKSILLVDSWQQGDRRAHSGAVDSCQQCQSPSVYKPCRPALPPLGFIVIARRLLDGAVLRLLHRLWQRNPAPRRLGEIAGAQPMRGIRLGSSPAKAIRLFRIPFTDCGVSALSSKPPH